MIYKVKAKIIDANIPEFFTKLTNGTIQSQQPDGAEIVASMKRAVFTSPGIAEWFETCYCATPLAHERATQYDFYFAEMQTETVEAHGTIEGDSLWEYLKEKSGS